jgi:hypothetical protein
LAHRSFRELAESFANCAEAAGSSKVDAFGDPLQTRQTVSLNSLHPQHEYVPPQLGGTASRGKVIACLQRTQAALRAVGTPLTVSLKTALPVSSSEAHPTQLCEKLALSCYLRAPHLPRGNLLLLCHDTIPLTQSLTEHAGNLEILSLAISDINRESVRRHFANTKEVLFSVCDSASLNHLSACDLLVSASALQFCPPPLSAALVRAALRALQPGGTAILQMLVEIDGYIFDIDAWLAATQRSETKHHALHESRVYEIAADQGCDVMVYDDIDGSSRTQKSSFFVIEKRSFHTNTIER